MLVEFQVGNHLSYRGPVVLSMQATGQVSEFKETNVIADGKASSLLKTAVIYGANASGKSNLLASMAFMRWFVINSSKEGQVEESIGVSPFRLDTATEAKPSRFEVVCLIDGARYRYGFEADQGSVTSEWLFLAQKTKETPLFLREGDSIDVRSGFKEGEDLEEKTRANALFLSVAANFAGTVAGAIIKWFSNLSVIHGLADPRQASVSKRMIQDRNRKRKLVELVRMADLGIEDILADVEELPPPPADMLKMLSTEGREKILSSWGKISSVSLRTVHTKFSNGKPSGTEIMRLDEDESEGTRKFFRLAGPVLETLGKGNILVVDELEATLHPLLTRMIVRLFHSSKSNPRNAQLIFATHDTNMLEHVQFRRDQIWFTEKDQQQATDLYSLAEIRLSQGDDSERKVRKDARYKKDYFKGKYGAVPYLGDFEALIKPEDGRNG